MKQIKFRLLKSADLESYRRIRLECLTNHPEFFGDTYKEEEIHTSTNKFYKVLSSNDSNSFLFGAFSGNILIGICGFIQEERIKTIHRGNLVQVYVEPSFSGRGIGNTLIKLTIAKAFENILIDQILLSVVYTNDKAVNLYKKLGFVQYGMIENYFKEAGNSWTQLFMTLTRENSQ
jgi:ribosomal protein S18 acetylase RimI-like enzyme